MQEDKAKSVRILENKLVSLQKSIKTLRVESEALTAAQRSNKRYSRLKALESDVQAQDYIISVFKDTLGDPKAYAQVLRRVMTATNQAAGSRSKEELRVELSGLTQQLNALKRELKQAQGLAGSRHEIAVDNASLNFQKAKPLPSTLSIHVSEGQSVDSKPLTHNGEETEQQALIARIVKNVKTYRGLLSREHEATAIAYDQNKDRILQARAILTNMQVVRGKVDEAKAKLIAMDGTNARFEAALAQYTDSSGMNLENLNARIIELQKLKEDVQKENDELRETEGVNDNGEVSEERQRLVAESQECKIRMLSLEEKAKALEEFIRESEAEMGRKTRKLENAKETQPELAALYDKKREDAVNRQALELQHIQSQKSKRENLMVKLRLVRQEESTVQAALEAKREACEAKQREFIALKQLHKDKAAYEPQYAVNADEEINALLWRKTRLEEQLMRKQLYLKHRQELGAISAFDSLKDVQII